MITGILYHTYGTKIQCFFVVSQKNDTETSCGCIFVCKIRVCSSIKRKDSPLIKGLSFVHRYQNEIFAIKKAYPQQCAFFIFVFILFEKRTSRLSQCCQLCITAVCDNYPFAPVTVLLNVFRAYHALLAASKLFCRTPTVNRSAVKQTDYYSTSHP